MKMKMKNMHKLNLSIWSSLFLFLSCIALFLLIPATAECQALPDFAVDDESITFSNNSPVEGELITISVEVTNVGDVASTKDEDLEVWLYEGPPEENPLQIMVKDILLELEPEESGIVKADWRPRTGTTEIYAIANPKESGKTIKEKTRDNNYAHRAITASARTFPSATDEHIEQAVKKGIDWIISQRGEHRRICPQCGSEVRLVSKCYICGANLKGIPMDMAPSPSWDFGASAVHDTSLALLALMGAGLKPSHPVIKDALSFLMKRDWSDFSVYDYAIVIPVFVATGQKEKYLERAQFATEQLIKRQLRVEKGHKPIDDGGWGYAIVADGAHMQYCIYALYAAKQWGIEIPQEVWDHAEKWIRRTQMDSGGWVYNLVESGSPWAEGVYGSMTTAGLMGLKMCGVPLNDRQIQKGLEWLKKYYTITSNPGAVHWRYYYLLALERFSDTPPKQKVVVGHNWYKEISSMLVAEQRPEGKWLGAGEQVAEQIDRSQLAGGQLSGGAAQKDFLVTCFAVLLLTRTIPQPLSPDLGINSESIKFSPSSPRKGKPVRITANIVNSGKLLEQGTIVDVDFYDGDPRKNGKKIIAQQAIFSGNRPDANVLADWKAPSQGLHHIYVQIDPSKKAKDANRKNNIASRDLIVKSADYNPMEDKSLFKKIADGISRLGNVTLDKNSREITMPGRINMVSGIIEFFACNPMGRTHESLLILDIEPLHLQLALIELGLKYGSNLRYQGDPRAPKGDSLEIFVEWKIAGTKERHRAEELILNDEQKRPMQKTNWVFTGARVANGVFTAQTTKNIIATMRDPDSIINHPLPGGTNTTDFYHANPAILPPRGTKVKVIIVPSSF